MTRIAWRHYATMHCASCYTSALLVTEAWFYTCTRCGAPSFLCVKCIDLARSRRLASVTTVCAMCNILEEVAEHEPWAGSD